MASDAESFGFAARYRLKKRREFNRLQNGSAKYYSKHFLVLVADSETQHSRLGITITTKVDKRAVVRNRLKRRIREIFRLNRYRLCKNFDMVVIARQNAAECKFSDIRREILGLLRYNGLVERAGDGSTD